MILPKDPTDQGDYFTGAFYSLGVDLGISLSPDVLLYIAGNLSIRTFDDVKAKQGIDKKTDNSDAIYNPSVSFGTELFKKVTLWSDLSWIQDPSSENKDSFGWRVGARGKVMDRPWGNLALQFGAMGIKAGQGAQTTEDGIVYLEEKTEDTQIIGPEGPVTAPKPVGGGSRSGVAVAGGAVLNLPLFDGGKLVLSLTGGGVQDDKMGDDYKPFVDLRTAFSWDF